MYLLGGSESDLPNLDGMDMWSSLSSDKASPRNLMLHNIDESRHIAAVRVGDWKLVKGRKKFVLFCNNAFSDFFLIQEPLIMDNGTVGTDPTDERAVRTIIIWFTIPPQPKASNQLACPFPTNQR